jgi:hypothetical protein
MPHRMRPPWLLRKATAYSSAALNRTNGVGAPDFLELGIPGFVDLQALCRESKSSEGNSSKPVTTRERQPGPRLHKRSIPLCLIAVSHAAHPAHTHCMGFKATQGGIPGPGVQFLALPSFQKSSATSVGVGKPRESMRRKFSGGICGNQEPLPATRSASLRPNRRSSPHLAELQAIWATTSPSGTIDIRGRRGSSRALRASDARLTQRALAPDSFADSPIRMH